MTTDVIALAATCDGVLTADGLQCIKYNAESLTFDNAQASCNQWGGRLAEILNSDIESAVETALSNTGSTGAWIGAKEDTSINSKLWTWTDGMISLK